MKALSVLQPWAWLIIHGGKDIENRSWLLPERMVGQRVAISTSARFSKAEWYEALMLIRERAIPAPVEGTGYEIPCRDELEFGVIVGTVELAGCVVRSESPWFTGLYGFVLRNPIALPKPIPCKGRLGFWNVPAEIEWQILESEARAK